MTEVVGFLVSDAGIGMFFAWVLFVFGIINIAREINIFAIDYRKKIYSCSPYGILRFFIGVLCFCGWWYLLIKATKELWLYCG